jgi:hypothetical protein
MKDNILTPEQYELSLMEKQMTETKLSGITAHGPLTIIHPLYQIFPTRLELIKFEDIFSTHVPHHDFKIKIREDIKQNGLLCPLVLTKENDKYELHSGNHRYAFIKKHATASLCYVAKTKDELFFLTNLNKAVWERHKNKQPVTDFEFLFENKMKKFTDKCLYLLTEGVKTAR